MERVVLHRAFLVLVSKLRLWLRWQLRLVPWSDQLGTVMLGSYLINIQSEHSTGVRKRLRMPLLGTPSAKEKCANKTARSQTRQQ